jgi:hypothetical protein
VFSTSSSFITSNSSPAICDFPRENEELQLEQELSRQSDSKIGTTYLIVPKIRSYS